MIERVERKASFRYNPDKTRFEFWDDYFETWRQSACTSWEEIEEKFVIPGFIYLDRVRYSESWTEPFFGMEY